MNQFDFASALLDPDLPAPAGLTAWNGSDPAHRFRIYRNNVIVSLIDALADTFEVTQQLVGEDFFRAMARVYAYGHPPQSRLMAFYGASFPTFIASFPPAAALPYLADVARLEYLRVVAYHAADLPGIGSDEVAAALAEQATLPTLKVSLHPSLAVLASASAVVSLWAAHQGILELSTVTTDSPETALVLRHGLDVEVMQISPAAGAFISALQSGVSLGQAAAAVAAIEADFDLVGTLGLLLQKSAITAL
ncbi:MAG: DNA-binding domain-containing protein [Gammaproteobacteria bacterium]|nr:DNA-binding domain-containing protein [Gammaproteobacteria bacterium]MBU2435612.1 DNA-binding domain-containing protein [Gammaproteobacteria bacterium]MBU2449607.1 DNA-binding domain-containing protein [Gammaproteobacteria bacterium]